MCLSEEQKNGEKKLDSLIAECGLNIPVITAENKTAKSEATSTRANVTSATINATASTGRRLCLLMNSRLGKVVSLGLLNGVVEIRDTRSGNEKYLHEIKSAYGVAQLRNLKPTISKDGVNIPNSATMFLMGALSV